MKYRLLITLFLACVTASSQTGAGIEPAGIADPSEFLSRSDRSHATVPEDFMPNGFPSHLDRNRTRVDASTLVNGMGFGVRSTLTRPSGLPVALQFSGGWITVPFRVRSEFETPESWASFIPMMIGGRIDIANIRNRSFEWSTFVVAGAGPLMGLEISPSDNLFQAFSRLAFKWGAGAYAGVGSELRLSDGWYAFAQLEWDVYGFLSPVGGKDSYNGPGFAIGIQSSVF